MKISQINNFEEGWGKKNNNNLKASGKKKIIKHRMEIDSIMNRKIIESIKSEVGALKW